MELRMNERRKDEMAHQILIQESYRESQERHAYRLAHPAYADGRIWWNKSITAISCQDAQINVVCVVVNKYV